VRHDDVAWELANCAGTDTAAYYADGKGNPPNPMVYRICAMCEIRVECQEWALQENEYGVWGGHYFMDREVLGGEQRDLHSGDNGDDVPEVWTGDQSEVQTSEWGSVGSDEHGLSSSRHPSAGCESPVI
jgi:hypothetical protein